MSTPLTIWLPKALNAPWHWRAGNEHGTAESDVDKRALSSQSSANVTLIIPGQWVRIFPHDLPKMRESDRLSAAGFAIEDKLGTPLVEQHLVIAPGEDRRVAVITKAKIASIRDALHQFGLKPGLLVADFDALSEQSAPLYLADRTVQPGPTGYTLDRDWTDGALPAAMSPDDALQIADGDKAINLMSGAFAPKRAMPLSLAALSKIAALVLITGLSWAGWQMAQTHAMNQQTDATRGQIAALYTEYTGDPAPANPALTVTRAVQSGGANASGDFIGLSSILFKALPNIDGITVETLQYDAAKHELSVRFIYPQFESATALEKAVNDAGGVFRAGGVREQGGRLIGDAAISAGGAK